MKYFVRYIVFAFAFAHIVRGSDVSSLRGPPIDRAAVDLYITTQPDAALARLKAVTAPENGPDGSTIALAQRLIEISCVFYNQRQTNLARTVAAQAFLVTDAVLHGKSNAEAGRRADLLSSLGMLSEHVLGDLKGAEALYAAASALSPGNNIHSARKSAVLAKQKPKDAAPGS
jgi:hypothetical protein